MRILPERRVDAQLDFGRTALARSCSNMIAYSRDVWLVLTTRNAARRILEWPELQQQLRDEKLISYQLPNNRVGTRDQRAG
jgi:hypothetical protein